MVDFGLFLLKVKFQIEGCLPAFRRAIFNFLFSLSFVGLGKF